MYIMCYDTYASDKKLINQIQHNTNNHTLKYCDQNGVKCFIFDIVCDILSCQTKVRLAAIHIQMQMSVNESIKAWVLLVTRLPWTFPARAAAPRAAGHGTTASSAPMTTTTSVSIRWGRKRI